METLEEDRRKLDWDFMRRLEKQEQGFEGFETGCSQREAEGRL